MKMLWVQLVTLLAILQFVAFGFLVGRARGQHNVPAPATTGNAIFERYFRVHMNTLETLVFLLPSLWLATMYWRAEYMAAIGAVYLVGRQLFLSGYVADPKKRELGYGLSFMPAALLLVLALIGVIRALVRG
jgi:glutathione S-transferase